MGEFVINNGLWIAVGLSLLGLAAADVLFLIVRRMPAGTERMREVAAAIETGAKAYLKRQILTILAIAAVIAAAIFIFYPKDPGQVTAGFLLGALCSLAAGYAGMRVAVMANVRTAQGATVSRHTALRVAFNGGAVTGLLVVGLGLLSVSGFYLVTGNVHSLIGLALGSSLISVFARLGGGIYTKAADVGADLVGKLETGLDEDDPRNPAVIADNVGDNVGDCAGMAADVFETYVVSLIGAILIGYLTVGQQFPEFASRFVTYPVMLGAVSILSAILGVAAINVVKGRPMFVLGIGVAASALVSATLFWPVTQWIFAGVPEVNATNVYYAALVGLALTGIVVAITDYYTAENRPPVQRIAAASQTGHATNIISGLAVGQHATAPAVGAIGLAILLSFNLAGLYGVAIAVVAMLSMAGIIISLDAFGPITDNAGGIAVMSGLPADVRKITDGLDAVGNTLKAVTKGYAIASAGLAALVLFGTYVEELRQHVGSLADGAIAFEFSLSDPKVIIGLFIGGASALLVYRGEHGRRRQGGRGGRHRSAPPVQGEAGHIDGGRQARLQPLRRHRHQGGAQGNDLACADADPIRRRRCHVQGVAGPGRSRRDARGHDCHRALRRAVDDEQRRRVGQRQEVHRIRSLRRQRVPGA